MGRGLAASALRSGLTLRKSTVPTTSSASTRH